MQSDVKFQEPFSYSILGVILLVLLIVILVAYLVYILVIKKKDAPKIVINYRPKNVFLIKHSYLSKIDSLKKQVNNKKLSQRKAYNELSSIIRSFVNEATSIDVMKYTLSEIKTLKMDNLTKLVEEYYEPEFSREGTGDILASIDRTREVIEKWK